jgi:carboxymethylenebutenolidase
MLHQALADAWVPPAVCAFIRRRLSPNPLVEIHGFEGADHAFARHGSPVFDAKHAARALALSVEFFHRHLDPETR